MSEATPKSTLEILLPPPGPWETNWTAIQTLGGGGQGDTLLVESKSDQAKRAVLKLLKPHKAQDPKARRRMYQEAANLKILRSAGGKVPEVLDGNTEDFEKVDVPLYFVMEFVAGDTLAMDHSTSRSRSRTEFQHRLRDCCARK